MQKMMIPILMLFYILLVQCSMPVSLEEDNTRSIGEKNAKLLNDKVKSIGENLNAIHVYSDGELIQVMPDFQIDGVYLIDKNGETYYNLSEMVAMTVEEVSYSQQTKVIKVLF